MTWVLSSLSVERVEKWLLSESGLRGEGLGGSRSVAYSDRMLASRFYAFPKTFLISVLLSFPLGGSDSWIGDTLQALLQTVLSHFPVVFMNL